MAKSREQRSLLDVLSSLGLDTHGINHTEVDWMWDVPCMKDPLQWFSNYVDSSNVLWPAEYVKLREENILSTEEIDEALGKALESPNLPKLTDLDIESELDRVNEELLLLEQHHEYLKDHLSSLCEQVGRSVEQEQKKEKELKSCQLESLRNGQSLMKLSAHSKAAVLHFYQSLTKLSSTITNFSNSAQKNSFFCQMPLDKFLRQCDKFDYHMNVFMRRHLGQGNSLKDSVCERSVFLFMNESLRMPDRLLIKKDFKVTPYLLWTVCMRKVTAKAHLDGLSAALDYLHCCSENIQRRKPSLAEVRVECISILENMTCESENNKFLEDNGVADAVEDVVLLEVVKMAEKVVQQRANRRKYRLEKLNLLRNCLDKQLRFIDLLWMLLRGEDQCIKVGTEFIDEASLFFQDEKSKHLASMAVLKYIDKEHADFKKTCVTSQCTLLGALQRMLRSMAVLTGGHGTLEVLTELETEKENLESTQLLKALIMFEQMYSPLESDINTLGKAICSGPTKKPVLLSPQLSLKVYDTRTKVYKLRKDLEALMDEYSTQQVMASVTRPRRLMWVWFLTSPDRLDEIIASA